MVNYPMFSLLFHFFVVVVVEQTRGGDQFYFLVFLFETLRLDFETLRFWDWLEHKYVGL